MTCIHNNFDDDDNWGGCIHCAIEERNAKFYDEHHPPMQHTTPKPEFIPNRFHYHTKLKKSSIIFIGTQFTIINYNSVVLSIPNKIIKLKGEKNKIYVHKNIFNSILIKNNLVPIP